MLVVLNLKEAKEWCNRNLYDADSYLFPLDKAVKSGRLMEIDKEHFAIVETICFGYRWVLDKIWRLTDEEMEQNNLYCRYRYIEHLVDIPAGYTGATEHNAGFNVA